MRTESHNFKELAQEYIEAGLYEDAIHILEACPKKDPICWYTLGYIYTQKEENKKAEFNVATKTQPLHGSNLFACVDAVLAVELIDTSAGSGCFLLACVE